MGTHTSIEPGRPPWLLRVADAGHRSRALSTWYQFGMSWRSWVAGLLLVAFGAMSGVLAVVGVDQWWWLALAAVVGPVALLLSRHFEEQVKRGAQRPG